MYFPLEYNEPVFRPPSEAYSLILQLTLGCSWNRCAFCEMYSSKKFKVRKEEEVLKEIKEVASISTDVKKIFLADGNAVVLSTSKLLNIINEINNAFPRITRISAYALPKDINSKTDTELKQLADAGLKLLYVGIESGDDELLKLINKGETFNSTVDGLQKARKAGIKLSVMILNGLGGEKYSHQHAINSAKAVNQIQPEFLSTLVLSFPYGEDHFKKRFKGYFKALSTLELIAEMKIFIETLELENSVFRSDHASNYLVLKGILNRDKQKFLDDINNVLRSPGNASLRQEWMRGL